MDADNGTNHLIVSPYFEGGQFVKQGAIVKMGVYRETFLEISNDKKFLLLLVVNREEYDKLLDKINDGELPD